MRDDSNGAARGGKGAYGYNVANDECGDMFEEGILDPTKVTRRSLQNAASVAGLLLTSEVMIAEVPKDEAEQAHMPPGAEGASGPCAKRCRIGGTFRQQVSTGHLFGWPG